MTGNELPEDGHVVRYVRPSLVEDETVDGSALLLRKGEATLSVNWLEAFGGDDQHHQLREVSAPCSDSNSQGPDGSRSSTSGRRSATS